MVYLGQICGQIQTAYLRLFFVFCSFAISLYFAK